MKIKCLVMILLLLVSRAHAQDEWPYPNPKSGFETSVYETDEDTLTVAGGYRIVSLKQFDTIRNLGRGCFEIHYKAANTLLFFSGKRGDSIAVQDSVWQTFDPRGKLRTREEWDKGVKLWSKTFDERGILQQYDYTDFEHDTSFYLTYRGGRLFKKVFYPPNDKNHSTAIFYPNDRLIIDQAELSCYKVYNSSVGSDYTLGLNCKKNLSVLSVQYGSKSIEVMKPRGGFPYKMKPGEQLTLHVKFKPSPQSLVSGDTITIVTSEDEKASYSVYCRFNAVHVDYSNVEQIRTMRLSKAKDKYLVVGRMGSVTDLIINYPTGRRSHYEIKRTTKIDLSSFAPGIYTAQIAGCETGGGFDLIVTE